MAKTRKTIAMKNLRLFIDIAFCLIISMAIHSMEDKKRGFFSQCLDRLSIVKKSKKKNKKKSLEEAPHVLSTEKSEALKQEEETAEILRSVHDRFLSLVSEPAFPENLHAVKNLLELTLDLGIPHIKLLYAELAKNNYFEPAIKNGNHEAVRFLLTIANIAEPKNYQFALFAGLRIDWLNGRVPRTLLLAIQHKNKKIVKLLLNFLSYRHISIIEESENVDQLLRAINSTDQQLMQFFTNYYQSDVLKCPTPFYVIADKNNSKKMRKHITDILIKARRKKRSSRVHSLKKLAARKLMRNFDITKFNVPSEVMDYLAQEKLNQVNRLAKAYKKNKIKYCHYLVEHGADIYMRNKYGLSYVQTIELIFPNFGRGIKK
jgi:hypothetical protein